MRCRKEAARCPRTVRQTDRHTDRTCSTSSSLYSRVTASDRVRGILESNSNTHSLISIEATGADHSSESCNLHSTSCGLLWDFPISVALYVRSKLSKIRENGTSVLLGASMSCGLLAVDFQWTSSGLPVDHHEMPDICTPDFQSGLHFASSNSIDN